MSDARRNVQLANLAYHALEPLLDRYTDDIITQLVGMVHSNSPAHAEKVWIALGKLAAGKELLALARSAQAGMTKIVKES